MNPTIVVALLSHPSRLGTTFGGTRAAGAPLHLSLHTSASGARAALDAAMIREWDEMLAYGNGPASSWKLPLLRLHMTRNGYTAFVSERPVNLDADAEAVDPEPLPVDPPSAEPLPPRLSTCGRCGGTIERRYVDIGTWVHVTPPAVPHEPDPDDSYVARS